MNYELIGSHNFFLFQATCKGMLFLFLMQYLLTYGWLQYLLASRKAIEILFSAFDQHILFLNVSGTTEHI